MTPASDSIRQAVFGTEDDAIIAERISGWCETHLRSGVASTIFEVARLGLVLGVRLRDGRSVAIKIRGPSETIERVRAVCLIQSTLHERGFPCPRPTLPPVRLGNGLASVEELFGSGEPPNAHLALVRNAMAWGLANQVTLCLDVHPPTPIADQRPAWIDYANSRLWPSPQHAQLDFESHVPSLPWVDTIAGRAKDLLATSAGTMVLGHSDYESHNVRVTGRRLTAVYDWDSLVADREEVIVGVAAAVFTANPDPMLADAPSPDERWEFVREYEAFRGRRFEPSSHALLLSASAWVTAYNVRLHHAFEYGQVDGPGSCAEALRALGQELESV
jgi:hypothetical protein